MEEVNWEKIIDNYVEAQREESSPPSPNVFRASSLSGCVRQCVRNRLGLTKLTAEDLRTFQIGTNLHRFIQTEVALGFLPHPMQFEKSVEFEISGIKITGHVDCYDGEIIYDFKTTKNTDWSLKYPTSKGYIMQLSAYLFALKAKKAILVYVDKNTYSVKQKEIKPILIEEIVEFCHTVMASETIYKTSGILPKHCADCYGCKKERESDVRS